MTQEQEPTTEGPVNGGCKYNGPKIERAYEALLLPVIGFGPFTYNLGGGRIRPPFEGAEPSVRYHFGRIRIPTLSLPKCNRGLQRFPRAGQMLAIECKGRKEA
ncbi:hypothetical protein AMTRI_Chr07g75430 [Amborella trichopoda]